MFFKLSLKLCPAVTAPGVTLGLCANEHRQRVCVCVCVVCWGGGGWGCVLGEGRGQRWELENMHSFVASKLGGFECFIITGKQQAPVPPQTWPRLLRQGK